MQALDTEQSSHSFHRRHKNAILLGSLILLILLAPLGESLEESKLLDMIMATIVVGASLNAIAHRRRSVIYWAVTLAFPTVIFGWIQTFNGDPAPQAIAHIFGAALYTFIGILLFIVLFSESEVSLDQIFSAVAIYIFIGLTWGHFYALEEIFHPGSIIGDSGDTLGKNYNYVYFSFVTLTTLGYGDMLPASAGAKSLVIVETITGVMFIAILVSTLVGRVNMNRK